MSLRGIGIRCLSPRLERAFRSSWFHENPSHLAEISRSIAPGAHGVLILDGAGWHGAAALVIPDNLSLLTLPPPDRVRGRLYSPELNPVENVWQYLRANCLAISVFDTYEAIVEACGKAWNRFADQPAIITSIASRCWATVI